MRRAPDVGTAIEWAKTGHASMTKCTAHDDGTESLSVGPGTQPNDDGVIQPVVFFCHAGCEPVDIIATAGVTWAEVCEPLDRTRVDDEVWTPRGNASHVYSYTDEHGEELFQTLRVPVAGGKSFLQRHRDPAERSGWAWNLQGVRRVLYHLPEVVNAVTEGTEVWVFEGEKDAERARADGKVATTSPMGAGKWRTEYGTSLAGANVSIVADNDEPGRKHAAEVYADLVDNHGCTVRILETTMANCKDYTDHRQHGGTDAMLVTMKSSAPIAVDVGGMGIQKFLDTDWPDGAEIIPGMLAEANVVILVGPEGHGKTTFLRQMAVQCASGIIPLDGRPMEPLRVMYVDAEVPERQQHHEWSRLAGLAARHTGEPVPDERLLLFSEWRSEPDLLTPDGQAWLHERIASFRPQVVFMGPVQNLAGRDTKDDEVVRRFKHAVNTGRSICGTAFVIEHHAPHRAPGDKERQMRPYGSSLFMKWPDFGYGLKPTEDEAVYDLYPFRRPRVRSRAWPERVRWGTPNTMEWPWMEAPPADVAAVLGHGRFGA
jgi:hypothetical protein